MRVVCQATLWKEFRVPPVKEDFLERRESLAGPVITAHPVHMDKRAKLVEDAIIVCQE